MYNDQLKINRLQTNVNKGYQLGTTNATWKKIKQATTVSNGASSKPFEANFIEQGPFGELLLVYPDSKFLEIWYWVPPQFEHLKTQDFSGDTLYFYGSVDVFEKKSGSGTTADNGRIHSVKIISGDLKEGYKILIVYKTDESDFSLQIHDFNVNSKKSNLVQNLTVPDFYCGSEDLSIKLNHKFIVVGNDEGYLYIYKYDPRKQCFVSGNYDDQLKSLKKSSCLPILRAFNLTSKVSDDEVVFKTSGSNSGPIFDLNNNWLVYCPTKPEYNQIKLNNYASNNSKTFTPVKLPNSKPLLNKLLESVSNQALDSLFKLSKFSSGKLNQYWSQGKAEEKDGDEEKEKQYDVTIDSIRTSLNSLFNSTVHSFNETTHNLQMNDNQILKIVDLSNDKILSIFKAPDGISNLSFNPYDLQLVNCNYRGDSFFVWDLMKLPDEVSLLGKFSRGKTSGIIDEIFWFTNNNQGTDLGISTGSGKSGSKANVSDLLTGTNSGFGCISKKTGSIHWFNINYLLGNLNNNLPNYLGKEFPVNCDVESNPALDKSFLNSWILSSSSRKYKKFVKLPNLLNLGPNNLFHLNQLAALDDHNNLRLISPLNGHNCYKFELPYNLTDPNLKKSDEVILDFSSMGSNNSFPLSQMEIETCKPFVNFLNLKNIEYSLYDFEKNESEDKSDISNFIDYYSKLNNNKIPYEKIKVDDKSTSTGKTNGNGVDFNDNVDNDTQFITKLVDDLTIDQNIS